MAIAKKEIVLLFVLLIIATFIRFYGLSGLELVKDERAILFPRHEAMTQSARNFILIPTEDSWEKIEGYNYTSDYVKYHFNKGTQSSTTPFGASRIAT